MIHLVTGIAFIALIWVLIFYQSPAKLWLPLIAIVLSIMAYFQLLSRTSLIILTVPWLILLLLALIPRLRIWILTGPFLRWFQRENPPLSAAEQQVINAGGVWWGNELFTGQPHWPTLLNTGKANLTEVEQNFLDREVTDFCNTLDEWRISHCDHDLSPESWEIIKTQRFWALEMEPQYGGHGFSPLAHSAIIAKIAASSVSAAITVMVPNSLGPAEFLKHYGTESQKNYYLPRLARGEEVACFALTGIEAGSDAASITDHGVVCYGEYQGQRVLGMRLNWNKRYITLAPIATLIGLAFHLYDTDRLLGETQDIGITLALIPAHLPGIEKGLRHQPLNMGFMNGPVRGRDVFVPLEQIIGGIEHCGQGWQMMMECLVVGRGISLPGLAVGMAQFCTRMTSAYALVRHQFNRPIIKFEGIQQALGRIGGLTYLSEALRLSTLQDIQAGGRPAVGSALTKYHLTEFSRQIVADSMDIHAGRGIQLGPNNYLSHLHAAVPINITVEGANILTRGLIIYGQGLLRCHPFLNNELTAAASHDLPRFDRIFLQHIGFTLSQISRLSIYSLTGGRLIRRHIPTKLKMFAPYLKQLTRMSNAFIVLTDITLLVLGKRLKIKEALSGRLGDVLSNLCMATSVVKYFYQQDCPEEQKIFWQWGLAYCFGRIQTAILDFLANFPIRWLGLVLRYLIFPWGVSYSGPADEASARIALTLCSNLPLREQLTQHCHLSGAAGKMEKAMLLLIEAAPLLNKIKALDKQELEIISPFDSRLFAEIQSAYQNGLINQAERDQLQAVADICWEVIQVDEFYE